MIPQRIQRKRIKGFDLQLASLALNGLPAVVVTRPGKFGNPFRVGGYFMIGRGQGHPGMSWCEALEEKYASSHFTKVADAAHAVAFFRIYVSRYPQKKFEELRGKNLACFCALDQSCHADVLLELTNGPVPA